MLIKNKDGRKEDIVLTSLFLQRCQEKHIKAKERDEYFLAHINRSVELLVNRVRGLENLAQLIKS